MTHEMVRQSDALGDYWECKHCGIQAMWEKSIDGLNTMQCAESEVEKGGPE